MFTLKDFKRLQVTILSCFQMIFEEHKAQTVYYTKYNRVFILVCSYQVLPINLIFLHFT